MNTSMFTTLVTYDDLNFSAFKQFHPRKLDYTINTILRWAYQPTQGNFPVRLSSHVIPNCVRLTTKANHHNNH